MTAVLVDSNARRRSATGWLMVYNGLNEITGAAAMLDGTCELAMTELRGFEDDGIDLVEADIWIDPDCDWAADLDYYDLADDAFNAGIFSLEQVVLHEMGHVAGLNHEDGEYDVINLFPEDHSAGIISTNQYTGYAGWPTTMEATLSGGSVIGDLGFIERAYYVNEDDRRGLRFLYPDSSNSGEDLAMQSYHTPDDDTLLTKTSSADCWRQVGERARPAPNADLILSTGECDFPLVTEVADPLPIYQGQPLEAVFTLLNLGKNDQPDVEWKVYLSATETITAPLSWPRPSPQTYQWGFHTNAPRSSKYRHPRQWASTS